MPYIATRQGVYLADYVAKSSANAQVSPWCDPEAQQQSFYDVRTVCALHRAAEGVGGLRSGFGIADPASVVRVLTKTAYSKHQRAYFLP